MTRRAIATLRTAADLIEHGLAPSENLSELDKVAARYAVAVTPDVAALIDASDPNDPIARQLLQDSLSKLRATLSELYDQEGSINLSMADKEKSGSRSEKPDNSLEVSIDLLAEDFALEDGQVAGANGLDLFV